MNIFGVGGAEFILILLIMLIIAGPKRMATWAVIMGKYVGKLRIMWSEVVDVVQKEIDEAGVGVQLPKELPTRQNISKMITDVAKPISQPLEQMGKQLEKDVAEDVKALKSVSKVELDPKSTVKTTQSVMGKPKPETEPANAKPAPEAEKPYVQKAKAAAASARLGAWANNGASDTSDASDKPTSGLGTWGQSSDDNAADSSADTQSK
ncbi:MAG: hypothetical protein KC708_24800 [Anaerolineae bacterium]|nr:hypothetical protein [Anaerolineae bacterium]